MEVPIDFMQHFLLRAKKEVKPGYSLKVRVYYDEVNLLRLWIVAVSDEDGRTVTFKKDKDRDYGAKTIDEAIQIMNAKIAEYVPLSPGQKRAGGRIDIRSRDEKEDYSTLDGMFQVSGPVKLSALRSEIRRTFKISEETMKEYLRYWLKANMIIRTGKAHSQEARYVLGTLPS